MIPILRRQLREFPRRSTALWLSVAALLAVPGLGCGSHTPAAGNRPPNAPEYAEHTPAPSTNGVLLDMPDPNTEVKNPDQAIALIEHQAAMVERKLRVARGQRNATTADCIDDKLSQIHAQARMSRDQSKVLTAAEASSDASREHQARVMIRVARDRASKLAREADRCGARVSNGRSEVDVQVDRVQSPSATADPMPVVPRR